MKWISAFLAAAVVGTAAPLPAGAAPAVDDNTIVVAVEKSFQNLDAQVAASGDSQRYAWQLYDTLYGFDAKGNLEPRAATGFKLSDDGLTYSYKLRAGMKFHDGEPVTAEDVKYSFDRILDPATKSTKRPYLARVDSVRVAAPDTVEVKLKDRDGAFHNKVANNVFIIPKKYATSLPDADAFARAPIGSGPYKLKSHKIGQELELERFDGYYGTKPAIKRLVFKIIPEGSTRANAIAKGEVDIVIQVPTNYRKQLEQNRELKVNSIPVASPMYVRLYTRDEASPLAKRDVRMALNLALDRKAIVDSVFHGVGKPLGTFISEYFPYGSDPAIKPYPYDPQKAKALLASAGYPKGFKTKLYSPSDQAPELAAAIAAFWQQIGVQTEIARIDYAAWSRLNNTQQSGPMTLSAFGNAIYDPINTVTGAFSKDGTWSSYYNPEVEAVIHEVIGTQGPEARGALFRKIGKMLYDDAAGVFINEIFYLYVQKSDLDWTITEGSGFLDFRKVGWKTGKP
ncbi:ABC transporter substrate-binding protein [Variovorax sp. KK3]|uniref:ABC transporter substrate-binding protein n=1 Tax=Variovorax sp. KK3 TaxID=1855728 RepID=UPI00097C60DE|nr:ABC transporter substrate-binding protein [Variovorax sp. KK3]